MTARNVLPILAMLIVAGCVGGPAAEVEAPAEPTPVHMHASDYKLEVPATIPAGLVEMTLTSSGSEIHHAMIYRLDPGYTIDDLRTALIAAKGAAPEWVTLYGGPNVALPGMPTKAIMQLDEGEYVAACVIPSYDHEMHLAKGMMTAFRVVASDKPVAEAPEPDMTVTLHEYGFHASPSWAVGEHVVRIVNEGTNEHELVLFELFGNTTTMELLQKIDQPPVDGEAPPGRPVAGLTSLSPGREATITVDLTPGRYTLVCFDADGTPHGEPHFLMGMIQEFTLV